jgi:hypothetical protein
VTNCGLENTRVCGCRTAIRLVAGENPGDPRKNAEGEEQAVIASEGQGNLGDSVSNIELGSNMNKVVLGSYDEFTVPAQVETALVNPPISKFFQDTWSGNRVVPPHIAEQSPSDLEPRCVDTVLALARRMFGIRAYCERRSVCGRFSCPESKDARVRTRATRLHIATRSVTCVCEQSEVWQAYCSEVRN